MRYQLIIKADPEKSIAALTKHTSTLLGSAPEIVGSHSSALYETSLIVDFTGETRAAIESALNIWFVEPPYNPPFAIGSLLFWSRVN
jgi:hypothetical protein